MRPSSSPQDHQITRNPPRARGGAGSWLPRPRLFFARAAPTNLAPRSCASLESGIYAFASGWALRSEPGHSKNTMSVRPLCSCVVNSAVSTTAIQCKALIPSLDRFDDEASRLRHPSGCLRQSVSLDPISFGSSHAAMSATKTISAAGVGFDSAAPRRLHPSGCLAGSLSPGFPSPPVPHLRASLAAEDLFLPTRPQRRRSGGRARVGRATSVIRPEGAGALVAAGSVPVPARCEHRLGRSTAWSGSLFPVAGCMVAATLRRAFVTNPRSGMRCGLALDLPPASGEALHHITRVEV